MDEEPKPKNKGGRPRVPKKPKRYIKGQENLRTIKPEDRKRTPKPKGYKHLSTILKEILHEGKGEEATALCKAVIAKAKEGDAAMAKLVFDRADGLLKQGIEFKDLTGLSDDELIARTKASLGGGSAPESDA